MGFETGKTLLRAMTEADLDRVMSIAASLPEAPSWPRKAYLAAIAPEAIPPRIALVAEVNGEAGCRIAGFAIALRLGPEAELESIAVDGYAQRRGIGRLLLAALIREVRLAGAAEMLLEVRASNQAAAHLYGRAGFAEIGRRRDYYLDPVEDAVLMRVML